jgi:hypothetical protein
MVSLRSLHDPAKGYNLPKILLMRIGKSQKACKNLTPEARKNRLLGTPFLIFRQKKRFKEKSV